ncbi:MAG: hypothetical protein LH467_15600 [Gemmatimonadaceae bacterium]|nr:hypothetical protein [Gemmatimonadaceae bacterium]
MSRPRLSLVALVCSLAVLTGRSADAQVERSVRAGDRVRVHALDGPIVIGIVETSAKTPSASGTKITARRASYRCGR